MADVPFITLLTSAIAIGTLLDRILVPPETAKIIADKIALSKSSTHPINDTVDFALRFFEERFLFRLFGKNPLSRSYMLRSSIFSIASLVCVLLYQNAGDIAPLKTYASNISNIFFFGAIIIANIIIDYISLMQTQIFISFANAAKQRVHKFVAIAADLIVTINVFIFIFALFTTLIISAFLSFSDNREIAKSKSSIEYVVTKKSIKNSQFAFTYHVIGTASVDIFGRKQTKEVVNIKLNSNDNFFNPIYFYTNKGDKNYSINGLTKLEIEKTNDISYKVIDIFDIPEIPIDQRLYYSIFLTSDSVEDSFLDLIKPSFSTRTTREFINVNAIGYNEFTNSNFCLVNIKETEESIYIEYNLLEYHGLITHCAEKYHSEYGIVQTSETLKYFWDGDVLSTEIPLSSFFLTTMTSTFIIYAMIFFITLLTAVSNFFSKAGLKIARYYLRAPFAITFFAFALTGKLLL